MANSNKTFIRVFGKGQDSSLESVEILPSKEVQLHDTGAGLAPKVVSCYEPLDDVNVGCVPKVICEVYDYGKMAGTNVVTTGLFLDAINEVSEPEDAGGRDVFASWEVDRFDLSKPCQIIEQYAAPTLDGIAERVLENTDPSRKLVSVRSWTRGAGRTTLSICLARRLAHLGKKVILVDGDIDNPRLASQLGITADHGWEAALTDDVELSDCCVSSVSDEFSILPLLDQDVDIMDQATIDRIKKTFSQLSSAFDIILIDAGPGSQIWDYAANSEQLGIVVVQDRRRPDTDVDDLINRMKHRNTSVLGYIENFSKAA